MLDDIAERVQALLDSEVAGDELGNSLHGLDIGRALEADAE